MVKCYDFVYRTERIVCQTLGVLVLTLVVFTTKLQGIPVSDSLSFVLEMSIRHKQC